MPKTTEQRTLDYIKFKCGKVKNIRNEGENQYFEIVCKNGHQITKEKRHLLYRKQYCTYYPCNKGRKTEWKDSVGFKLFKLRLREIFDNDVICIEKNPESATSFLFKCNKCGHQWKSKPSYQLTTPKNKKRPPSCKKCGGSEQKSKNEKKEYIKELNIRAVDGISKIKNQKIRYEVRWFRLPLPAFQRYVQYTILLVYEYISHTDVLVCVLGSIGSGSFMRAFQRSKTRAATAPIEEEEEAAEEVY